MLKATLYQVKLIIHLSNLVLASLTAVALSALSNLLPLQMFPSLAELLGVVVQNIWLLLFSVFLLLILPSGALDLCPRVLSCCHHYASEPIMQILKIKQNITKPEQG